MAFGKKFVWSRQNTTPSQIGAHSKWSSRKPSGLAMAKTTPQIWSCFLRILATFAPQNIVNLRDELVQPSPKSFPAGLFVFLTPSPWA